MKYQLEPNEFSSALVLEWLNAYFGGVRGNGVTFKPAHIDAYLRIGSLPQVYGGFPISCATYPELGNFKIITIQGITRDEVLQWLNEHPGGVLSLQELAVKKWRRDRNNRNKDVRQKRLIDFQKAQREERERKKLLKNATKYLKDDE